MSTAERTGLWHLSPSVFRHINELRANTYRALYWRFMEAFGERFGEPDGRTTIELVGELRALVYFDPPDGEMWMMSYYVAETKPPRIVVLTAFKADGAAVPSAAQSKAERLMQISIDHAHNVDNLP